MPRLIPILLLLCLALPAQAACRLPDGAQAATTDVIRAINAARHAASLPPITRDARLDAAAQGHACDSAATGRMSHISADGRSAQDRIDAQGYPWRRIAENVAQGQRTGAAVVGAWMGSPSHRRNILMPRARNAGVGVALQPDGQLHWVLTLASDR